MPVSAPRICGQCGGVHAHGERCPKRAANNKARKAQFDKKRPSARERGYTKEWERERREYLAAYPFCRRCGAPADLVDHIQPHKGNKVLFWNRSNWQPLCTPCHSGAKQSEDRRNQRKD